jgi:hypothetical protein
MWRHLQPRAVLSGCNSKFEDHCTGNLGKLSPQRLELCIVGPLMLMLVVASLPLLLARHLQVHLNRVTPVEEMEIESHPIIESISFKEPSGRPVVCSAKIVTLSCSEKIWKLWGLRNGGNSGCTAPVHCCLPGLQGSRCCLEWTLLTLVERFVVLVVFVCWLRVDIAPLSVVLGALGSLRLLPILTIHSLFPIRALVDCHCNSR